jgi:hypothetical protein
LVIIASACLAAYFAVPFPFLNDANRDDAREATIRWLLHHNDSGLQDHLEVCFIGVGTTFDPSAESFDLRDPTKELLARFSDFPVPTHPVSGSVEAPPRKPGYVDSPDGGIFTHVEDERGRPSLIFAAGRVKRWSLGIAVCRGYYYEAGLSSATYDVYMLRLPFTWLPVWSYRLWIS